MIEDLLAFFDIDNKNDLVWLTIGIAAQLMFTMRFLIQWISSERARASVIPVAFWWFSLAGGVVLFIYGIRQREPVIMMGQSFGIIIYIRNLWFIYGAKS